MSTFNSLGSNYSWQFVWQNLVSLGSAKRSSELAHLLGDYYHGQATLTYKGREALELALRRSGLPAGSQVAINGFTCYVVYEAITQADYKPVFVDIEGQQLHFDTKGLKAAHAKAPKLRAVVIQNTLGLPVNMTEIEKYCRKNELLLIEDLAHSEGASYQDGQEAGKVGDLTMLSFSQDKPLDVVAGGALIDRREGVKAVKTEELGSISPNQQLKNRTYPLWTGLIRLTYPLGLGRYLHFGLKKANWLSTPMDDNLKGLHQMSPLAAHMLLTRWKEKDAELAHRRTIAKIYTQKLKVELIPFHAYGQPSYLRFPIWVESRDSLVAYLKKHDIYIGDTWYDAVIAPSRYLSKTSYRAGECPNAELLAAHIVNLPTHRGVTPAVAESICAKISQWQSSASKT